MHYVASIKRETLTYTVASIKRETFTYVDNNVGRMVIKEGERRREKVKLGIPERGLWLSLIHI